MHTWLWKEVTTCLLSARQTVSRKKTVGWRFSVVTMLMNAGDRWAGSHLCNKSLLEGSPSPVPLSKMKLHFFMLCWHNREFLCFIFPVAGITICSSSKEMLPGVNNVIVPNVPLFEDFRICLGYEDKGWVTISHVGSWGWASRVCICYKSPAKSWMILEKFGKCQN